MANLLRRFNKQVIGSDGKLYDYLAKITAYGDFKRVEDLNAVITSWNNIILTPKRTYLFDPEYGSNLQKIVFEPVDEGTVERIKSELMDTLMYYDSRATIEDIIVTIQDNGKGYQVTILANYEGANGTLTVSFDDSTILAQTGGATS